MFSLSRLITSLLNSTYGRISKIFIAILRWHSNSPYRSILANTLHKVLKLRKPHYAHERAVYSSPTVTGHHLYSSVRLLKYRLSHLFHPHTGMILDYPQLEWLAEFAMELVDGLEPPTYWLQINCSTDWAIPAYLCISVRCRSSQPFSHPVHQKEHCLQPMNLPA